MHSDESNIIATTIDLQRYHARALRLAVSVMHGPDPELRAEAVAAIEHLAASMEDSTARLEELL